MGSSSPESGGCHVARVHADGCFRQVRSLSQTSLDERVSKKTGIIYTVM